MEETHDRDVDFEFFDTEIPLDVAPSPGNIFLPEDLAQGSPHNSTVFGSPLSPIKKKHPAVRPPFLDSASQNQVLSPHSSASPAGSFQDSSSDSSRYKRKSSSDSSRSAITGRDLMMADADADADSKDWKVDDMMTGDEGTAFGDYGGTIDPSSMSSNFGFSDKTMENDFDFDSAASSPIPFGIGPIDMESPEMPTIKYDTPRKISPKSKTKYRAHSKAHSVSGWP